MNVVGEFTVPAEAFALDHALSTVPEMTVEADRVASHAETEVLPFLWASGGDAEAFHRALEADDTVEAVSVADETEETVLYRLRWSREFRDLIGEMVDHHAAVSEATAADDRWLLTLRFASEEQISAFQDHFRETGREFTIRRLSRPEEPHQREYGLTDEQYEALVAAAADGYFRVPRETSAEDLGERLGVSANAASQRLRRGSEALVRNALSVPDDDLEGPTSGGDT